MRIRPMIVATLVACGGAASAPPPIVVPPQPDAGASATTTASPPPERVEKKKPPVGSDGPADAVALVGEAGKIVPPLPEEILFVNGARIRVHPSADAFRRGDGRVFQRRTRVGPQASFPYLASADGHQPQHRRLALRDGRRAGAKGGIPAAVVLPRIRKTAGHKAGSPGPGFD